MKSLTVLFVLLVIFISGCDKSSKEEAIYTVQGFEDFRELVQCFSFGAECFGYCSPRIEYSFPDIKKYGTSFIHEVIYITKEGKIKLVFLDGSRPPKVVYVTGIK